MLIDLRTGGSPTRIETDVCIIGSGPAGMTIAAEFMNSGKRICLLEAGGDSEGAGDLCAGSVDSPDGYLQDTLRSGRARRFGGSAHLWKHRQHHGTETFVRCLPFDAIDFEKRAWVPESGWPFSREDLEPFYKRARQIFGIRGEVSAAAWNEDAGSQPWAAGDVETIVSEFGDARKFQNDIPTALAKARDVQVLLHGALRRLTLAPLSRAVVSAEAEPCEGRTVTIHARQFVLAAGGLENPRILLLNDSQQGGGMGNQYDLVGRHFMDHPSVVLGMLHPASPSLFETSGFFDQHPVRGRPIMGLLHIREEVMRREEMLNLCGALAPHFKDVRSTFPTFWKTLARETMRALRRKLKPLWLRFFPRPGSGATAPARTLLDGYYEDNYTGWSRIARKSRRFGAFSIRSLVEQVPDAANRVMLDEPRDRFGQRKVKVVWRWNDADLHSIRRAQAIFAHELAAGGIGRFTPTGESAGPVRRAFHSPHHFMGTTRMHREERHGVVNENCRVHGIPNLFIAGSSVFPTGSFANPTLTIVALALRLADHLKDRERDAT